MADQYWSFKDIQVLIHGTRKSVNLHGKEGFVNETKLNILIWGDNLDHPFGSNTVTSFPVRGRQEDQS